MENPTSGGNPASTSNPSPLEDMMKDMMREMRTRFDAMDNRFHELSVETDRRLHNLEQPEPTPIREQRPPHVDRNFHDQRGWNNFRPPQREYNHRREYDQDERILKSVKIEAPSFEGQLDPTRFLDWLSDMDHYFEWYNMDDERRIRFAKMKLLGSAKLYWSNHERLMQRGGRTPITTWDEMKMVLKEKYVPTSYQQRMLDQWQRLSQGSKPVSDYISRFDEFLSRCDLREEESVILSRFRAGLREDLQRELFLRGVSTVQEAYELVQELDHYHKMPPRRYDPAPRAQNSFQPPSHQVRHTPPVGQYKAPNPYIDKGKALMS
jgi:hypothetical protein